jgi:hypothetical protein
MAERPRYEWYIDSRKVAGCGLTIVAAGILSWLLYVIADLLDRHHVDVNRWVTVSEVVRPATSSLVLLIIIIAIARRRPAPLTNGAVVLQRDAFPTFTLVLRHLASAFRVSWLPRISAAAMLFFVFNEQPNDFYVLLRWFVSGTALLLLVIAVNCKQFAWAWLAGMTGILFTL